MIRTLISFLIASLLSTAATCQVNLVKNGGFDTISTCPTSLGQLSFAQWTIPSTHSGSSDLFDQCGNGTAGVPANVFTFYTPAFNGTGYAGGYLRTGPNSNYREYLTDTLIQPLVANKKYVVSFMYRLAGKSRYATDDMGFYLSNTFPVMSGTGTLTSSPTSHNPSGNMLSDTANWLMYSDTIFANGGELYLTIGAFDSTASGITVDSNAAIGGAYMFYDSISVFEFQGIEAENFCFGDSVQFSYDTLAVDSMRWNFGEPSSGSENTSTLYFPAHQYADTGSYLVTLIAHFDTVADTLTQEIYIYPQPQLDLGPDLSLCSGDSVAFDIGQSHASFLWQDSTSFDSLKHYANADSLLWAIVYGVCDTLYDSVLVTVDEPLTLDLGPDTLVCDGEVYVLDAAQASNTSIQWSTGDTVDVISVLESDAYAVTVSNACGTVIDSVNVTFKPVPLDSFLPSDTLNCFDNPIVLVRPDQDSVTYIWSDSTSKKNYTVDTTETVWLAAFNECGFSVDTINIIFNGEILSELGEDTNICEGDSILLIATHPGASYVWNTGDTTDTVWTDQVESFNYVVTVSYKACETIESKRVDMDDFFCEPIDCVLEYPNTFSPNGDGINDIFRAWSDCEIYSYVLTVYNRWGQLVHHDVHDTFGWDGTSNGQPAPEGVYFFQIDFLDNVVVDEDRKTYQGSVTLVR